MPTFRDSSSVAVSDHRGVGGSTAVDDSVKPGASAHLEPLGRSGNDVSLGIPAVRPRVPSQNPKLEQLYGEDLSESDEPTIDTVMAIQALLLQFSNSQVRKDLESGKFEGLSMDLNLAPLDGLRCLLLPRWQGPGFATMQARIVEAKNHFKMLLQKSPKILKIQQMNASYAEWFHMLQKLAQDKYWTGVKPDERCAHFSSSDEVSSHSFKVRVNTKKSGKQTSLGSRRKNRSHRGCSIEEVVCFIFG